MCNGSHWRRGHDGPPWISGRMHKRRFLFFRFALAFGAVLVLFLLGLVITLALVLHPQRDTLPRPPALLLLLCGVPLAFTVLSGIIGGLAFRRISSPMVDMMTAADAVAEGDLSVRVREDIPGEFGRMARSFNRMTAELARAEQQRRNLTADVAHELRTPLHIIQGNLEGILDGVYTATPEHIAATVEETRLLARLVSDLQTLSLAEAGQLPLHKTEVLVVDLLEDVATSFSGQAAEAGVELVVDAANDARDLTLHADSDRLDQVLSNLVVNALRYTPAGGRIILRAEHLPAGDTPAGVRLVVEDTGEGIPAEDLPFIFDRFWKADRARSRQTGSGLGLAIARQLVQAHGGKIDVESQPGRGTRFTIEFYGEEAIGREG